MKRWAVGLLFLMILGCGDPEERFDYSFDQIAKPILLSGTNASLFVTDEFGQRVMYFDGSRSLAVPDNDLFTPTDKGFTVTVWIHPETLEFKHFQGNGYVHWMGKGENRNQEWAFRIYNQINGENRASRISFYVFDPEGDRGIGSYFQDPLFPGEWIHVAAVYQDGVTRIYRNGVLRDSDDAGSINVKNGPAPLRIGTRDGKSYFEGLMDDLHIFGRALTDDEIQEIYKKEKETKFP